MQNAKELTEIRLKMKSALIAHDLACFRASVAVHGAVLGVPEWMIAKAANANDAETSELMHTLKCGQPYLGDEWQFSRNFFRLNSLQASVAQIAPASALHVYLETHEGVPPACHTCRYFRDAPEGQNDACMHLGSTPLDYACVGWTPVGEAAK